MNICEKVARVIYETCRLYWKKEDGFESDPWDKPVAGDEPYREMWQAFADVAITTFLKAAAEQGWHMRPDEATEEMVSKGLGPRSVAHYPAWTYRDMLAAAPEFKWKDD